VLRFNGRDRGRRPRRQALTSSVGRFEAGRNDGEDDVTARGVPGLSPASVETGELGVGPRARREGRGGGSEASRRRRSGGLGPFLRSKVLWLSKWSLPSLSS
jgi:hypothetical protein